MLRAAQVPGASNARGRAAVCAIARADAQLPEAIPAGGKRRAALRQRQRVPRAAGHLRGTDSPVSPLSARETREAAGEEISERLEGFSKLKSQKAPRHYTAACPHPTPADLQKASPAHLHDMLVCEVRLEQCGRRTALVIASPLQTTTL